MLNKWKFASHASDISEEQLQAMSEKIESLWTDPKSSCWQNSFHGNFFNVTFFGIYKEAGYAFDLRSVLKKWLVKDTEYRIEQYYAPNKTSLRTSGRAKKRDKIAPCPENF